MDRRSWPWKKKSSDKISATVLADNENPLPLNNPTKLFNERQAEERLQVLSDKLSVALSENTAKENMVKQHTKVAEEAVCGWEKAEAETASLKLELENTVQQKAAVEKQLSHVDGALKECMRELRQAREDQEQKLHELTIKNKREKDKAHAESEAKLAEMDRRLLESKAENEVMTISLKERGRAMAELNNTKAQIQTELSISQIRLDSAEKENASLKYEVQVLNKELDIRNEEKEYSKRESEVCKKQHIEDTKKIAQLEAECQKLKVFVRRKLPGPAALAQMKSEVGLFGSESGDPSRRRISGNHPGAYGASHLEAMQQRLQNGNREVGLLTDRMHVLEEETRILRESLAQRNSELHSARLMCARTASKLSTVESQLEAVSHCSNHSGPRHLGVDAHLNGTRDLTGSKTASVLSISDGSIQDDEASSDAWASALISELALLRKEKPSVSPENLLDSEKLSLMDDFTEMEQLASSVMGEDPTLDTESNNGNEASKVANAQSKDLLSSDVISVKKETQNINLVCMELRTKLAVAEKQLSEWQSKYNENEIALVELQERLSEILDAHSKNVDLSMVVEKAGAAITALKTSSQSRNGNRAIVSNNVNSELVLNYQKVIKVMQKLAHKLCATSSGNVSEVLSDGNQSPVKPRNPDPVSLLDDRLQILYELSNKCQDGESSLLDLMKELYLFVDYLANVFVTLEVPQKTINKLQAPCNKEEIQLDNSLTHNNLKAESERFAGLEAQFLGLKAEKSEIEHSLKEALQKIESITVQLVNADQLVTELQDKLGSCQQSRREVEEQLATIKALSVTLESQVKSRDTLLSEMKEEVCNLEAELQEERDHSQETMMKLQELQQQFDRLGICAEKTLTEVNTSQDFHPSAETVAKSHKEKEITDAAEKLAECQRSILVLGEQLKALTSAKQSPDTSFRSKTSSFSTAEKVTNSLEPTSYHSEELQSEMDVSGQSMLSGGYMCSPKSGWPRVNGYHGFDRPPPMSPPNHDTSAYAQRGQLGNLFTERKLIQVDPDRKRTKETRQPEESAYSEAEMSAPASLVNSSHYSKAKSPTTFLAMKKRGSNSENTSKAYSATRSEKTSSSALGRFFSRTKSQFT